LNRFLGIIKNIKEKMGALQIIDFILGLFIRNKSLVKQCKYKKKREIIEINATWIKYKAVTEITVENNSKNK